MTTTPDFRELCAELVKRLDELNCNFDIPSQSALIECANDALATPPPEPPTDEEIANFLQERWHRRMAQESPFGCTDYDGSRAKQASIDDTRAALERWGK